MRVAGFWRLRCEVGRHVLHVLIGQRARETGHDRIAARCRLAFRRLEVVKLLDEILGMLAGELWIRAAGAVAVRSVAGGADLCRDCLPPVEIGLCLIRCHCFLHRYCRKTCRYRKFKHHQGLAQSIHSHTLFRLVGLGSAKYDGDRSTAKARTLVPKLSPYRGLQ
ncbi:protein of unknown function [Paraburkholderia kururiensis]